MTEVVTSQVAWELCDAGIKAVCATQAGPPCTAVSQRTISLHHA